MTSTEQLTMDREGWLRKAADEFRKWIMQVSGVEVPDCRISMGFGGVSYEKKVRGVTWKRECDGEGLNQIFISPELDDTVDVLAVLLHELIHACLDAADDPKWNQHGGAFAEYGTRLGLCAPFTSAIPDVPTMALFMTIAADLGPFPHAKLTIPSRVRQPEPETVPVGRPQVRITSAGNPQRNRWISFTCPLHVAPVRMSRTKAELGAPFCGHRDETGKPCLTEMVEKV